MLFYEYLVLLRYSLKFESQSHLLNAILDIVPNCSKKCLFFVNRVFNGKKAIPVKTVEQMKRWYLSNPDEFKKDFMNNVLIGFATDEKREWLIKELKKRINGEQKDKDNKKINAILSIDEESDDEDALKNALYAIFTYLLFNRNEKKLNKSSKPNKHNATPIYLPNRTKDIKISENLEVNLNVYHYTTTSSEDSRENYKTLNCDLVLFAKYLSNKALTLEKLENRDNKIIIEGYETSEKDESGGKKDYKLGIINQEDRIKVRIAFGKSDINSYFKSKKNWNGESVMEKADTAISGGGWKGLAYLKNNNIVSYIDYRIIEGYSENFSVTSKKLKEEAESMLLGHINPKPAQSDDLLPTDVLELGFFISLQEYQKKGLISSLLRCFMLLFPHNAIVVCTWEFNDDMIRLLKSFGFQELTRVPDRVDNSNSIYFIRKPFLPLP
jgi:hypothetical protein